MRKSQVQHIALRMAAAKPVRQCRQACKQGDGAGIVAEAECDKRLAGGQAWLPRGRTVACRQ
jgi:hypothetical protein